MHRDIATQYAGMYFTAGIHPSEAERTSEEELAGIAALLSEKKVRRARGDRTGLSLGHPLARRPSRRSSCASLCSPMRRDCPCRSIPGTAVRTCSPFCANTRALLKRGFLMHCYSHGAANLPAFSELGAYFSFGGVACFKNAANVWESVKACPRGPHSHRDGQSLSFALPRAEEHVRQHPRHRPPPRRAARNG